MELRDYLRHTANKCKGDWINQIERNYKEKEEDSSKFKIKDTFRRFLEKKNIKETVEIEFRKVEGKKYWPAIKCCEGINVNFERILEKEKICEGDSEAYIMLVEEEK